MRILILGYIIRAPLGGMCFHHLQYMLSLKKLGHEILFYEDSDDYPGYYNSQSYETAKYSGFKFIHHLFNYYDLEDRWVFFDSETNSWFGFPKNKFDDFCSTADIVINISGVNVLREWWSKIQVRALVDTDPVFNQIKNLTDENLRQLTANHTCHFSFGENASKVNKLFPKDGFLWKPTRQPVVLDIWSVENQKKTGKWTTVMQWDSYKKLVYKDVLYGMKSDSFYEFTNLPNEINEEFEIALKANNSTVIDLKNAGWNIIGSVVPTRSPKSYQKYIANSKGEWSVAKHGYVKSQSGWFSERSLSYLASGKPVIVQDTGFSTFLPVGEGVLCFSTLEEAVDQIHKVNVDYSLHCKGARRFVEDNFEGKAVMKNLLENIS